MTCKTEGEASAGLTQSLMNIERDAGHAALNWRKLCAALSNRREAAAEAGRPHEALVAKCMADLCLDAAQDMDKSRRLAKKIRETVEAGHDAG